MRWGLVQVQRRCWRCNAGHEVWATPDELDRWRSGELAQHVWPLWTPEKRDQLITGLCRTCQHELERVDL